MNADPARSVQDVIQDLMQEHWVSDLFRELSERQAASARFTERLRQVDAGSQLFWPFQAVPMPIIVTDAQGSRITDIDGNAYLDCHMSYSAQALHGHNPAPVVNFIREWIGSNTGNGYTNPMELDLADLLRSLMPHCEKFAFLHSGSDATHAAIRLSRAFTGRRMVAKFEGTLHGSHDLVVQNTAFWYHGQPAMPFPEIGSDGVPVQSAFAGVQVNPTDLLVLPNDTAAAVELIERHAHELACVLAEPAASSFPFEEVTIPMTREVAQTARRLGVPFILDEVLTGFRMGIGGAAVQHNIEADLYTYGKVISGLGIPLSAVGGRGEILDLTQTSGEAWSDYGQKTAVQGSHTCNFLALCASYSSLTLQRDKGDAYYTDIRAKIATIRQRLAAFRTDHDIPLRLIGFGDFIGCFQFLPNDSYTDYRQFAKAMNPALFLLTLLLRKRNVYTLGTPMFFASGAHTTDDIETLITSVTDAALEMKKNGFPFDLHWPDESAWGASSAGSWSSDSAGSEAGWSGSSQ
jgi:glutamate-1-semialdehyde 2,1-aminomutase